MSFGRFTLPLVLFAYLFFTLIDTPFVQANTKQQYEPQVSARSALLMDVSSGQILYGKNHREPRPMASTTKIMTAVVALGAADAKSTVTVSSRAAAVGESSMYLEPGEKLTLEQLLYGAMLRSGNDACVAIAEHVAGTEEAFVLLMNEKAVLLGTETTRFRNTNGLPAPGHYSTARDLALLARYALHNPDFCRIVKTRTQVIEGPGGLYHYLQNTNKLLWRYPGADGVKTGTTVAAGKCLVASATQGDRRLVAVILNGNDRFEDAARLLDYGFEHFKTVQAVYAGAIYDRVNVAGGIAGTVPVKALDDITVNLRVDGTDRLEKRVQLLRSISAPVYEGQPVGKMHVLVNGEIVGVTDIVAGCTIEKSSLWQRLLR
ncbi:D-alanyl-D-alanine carboxypeptidase family protein [Desulfallas thermosapovorans]|uniref:serine-type D-Ala-D-Ala carboxypeptidase n=1 Tax=Desulfallas thermosapovorans DSM 6562 TaxID=1121431 RepID=A0A5S5A050_9FIRM|nr:D-alanyl-D-alanine carboxypeptidase family protein [Desulfallas thermosapovorans]TYO97880.1 D-alanyl-D-alanine carboxypeptidase (penicillin-binding protein 5/6) [Desulfallas thermosapovorans DSM 6562]